ncbi:hypothetical protein RIF29_37754 [Crotalaria pallida]|uniref:Glycosyl hydrolase family 13 catalytic domain-containing protein n=1 Tax=Crotalaria pallida TaxID=3830 RepID=A0AAN9HNZ5_CROPI
MLLMMANLVPSSFSLIIPPSSSSKPYSSIPIPNSSSSSSSSPSHLAAKGFNNLNSKLHATSSSSLQDLNNKAPAAVPYLFRTHHDDDIPTTTLLNVYVSNKNAAFSVYIEVSLPPKSSIQTNLALCWATHTSHHSLAAAAADGKGFNLTPFHNTSPAKFVIELDFEAKLVPFYLSFYLKILDDNGFDSEIRSHRNSNFCVPVGSLAGSPSPLGLSFGPDASINFAVYSRHAHGVLLCLYDDNDDAKPALELHLDPYVNRSGDIWHISFQTASNFVSYGYRFKTSKDGDYADEHVVLDPYAKIIGNSHHPKNLGCLGKQPAFDWGDDDDDYHPNLSMENLVVYRLNVKRFTQHDSSQLPTDIAGTFSGLAKKLQHFKDLGVNALLLEPVFTFDQNKGPYFPCHFFSPMHIYGPSGAPVSAINSMKEMVKTMHANGIQVLVEVVFSHTADIDALQGIDDWTYYYSANGAGDLKIQSALNCNCPIVQNLILDSLRYWVTEFHIDGFSFINASHLLRGFHGEYLSRPPLIEAIAFDPILSKTKIIADCWDPHGVVAKDTRFPHWMRWAEINTNFCNDVRNFLRGEGLLSNLATRLCGSGDMFSDGRGPSFSFNYITRNFGLSLVDLVSFSDGELAAELSWNCGEEGPTNDTIVLERRLKQIRNFLFILFVSLGVPVLNMGDECGQSSGGSPAYGDIKPFNWTALKTGFGKQTTQFISFLSSLRKRRSDLLQSRSFLKEENIEWHGSDLTPPRWDDPSCKFLAMTLKAEKMEFPQSSSDISRDLFIAFNAADHPEIVVLPLLPEGVAWYRLVDTALPFPAFISTSGEFVAEQTEGLFTCAMKSYSCTLFEASNGSS